MIGMAVSRHPVEWLDDDTGDLASDVCVAQLKKCRFGTMLACIVLTRVKVTTLRYGRNRDHDAEVPDDRRICGSLLLVP
jgi:hypothetical protein